MQFVWAEAAKKDTMPKLTRHEFNMQQKKKLTKKLLPKRVTSVKKMNQDHIRDTVKKASVCKVQCKCCLCINLSGCSIPKNAPVRPGSQRESTH